MTTDELERLLEASTETQRVDFKSSCEWSETTFAKDILALSNVEDGGYIVIGVAEKPDSSFERQSIQEEHKATYIIDKMRDQMAKYADPHVDFSILFVQDKQGLEYGVLVVKPFLQIPVICRRDSQDTKAGIIYYRNRNRRVESAPVSNSYDLRDILERAAVKLMQGYRALGLTVQISDEERLRDELEGL